MQCIGDCLKALDSSFRWNDEQGFWRSIPDQQPMPASPFAMNTFAGPVFDFPCRVR
jgi:hypothetical protein